MTETTISVRIDKKVHNQMRLHDEINWSAVIRRALQEYLRKLQIVEEIASKSRFTEADAEEIGDKIKHEIAKRHGLIK